MIEIQLRGVAERDVDLLLLEEFVSDAMSCAWFHQPVQSAAREMIVLELYRRGAISSGKAADLLAISRLAFIQRASKLGIPYLEMTEDEWATERAASESL